MPFARCLLCPHLRASRLGSAFTRFPCFLLTDVPPHPTILTSFSFPFLSSFTYARCSICPLALACTSPDCSLLTFSPSVHPCLAAPLFRPTLLNSLSLLTLSIRSLHPLHSSDPSIRSLHALHLSGPSPPLPPCMQGHVTQCSRSTCYIQIAMQIDGNMQIQQLMA